MNPRIKKVEDTLTSVFNSTRYTDLIREIFPSVKIVAPDKFNKEWTNFASHIEGSYHVGNYVDPDGKKLIIHSVQLVKQSYVENSRSTQRSYAKKLMESGNADAAIVAFFTRGDPKWRLSFVRLDYELKFENGKLSTTENMTPAKRYSYLVGKDEPCHTAISRFHQFITDDPNVAQPSLDDLEEAFSVEKVTQEFFNLYCEKFHQLREALEANPDFVEEAKDHNFTSSQFAKKLMGQIVFLYFLQKKGWLGVGMWTERLTKKQYDKVFYSYSGARKRLVQEYLPMVYVQACEDEFRLKSAAVDQIPNDAEELIANAFPDQRGWGSGSKTFMRTLFTYATRRGGNFFDDYLEPLFYNALNVNRGESGYDPDLHCRIPFLSGGLFEPIDGYDWKHNDFAIPNEIFSNRKDENDRDADGILDIFDRYNFTMSEDEPLEREVAIDPEMLGKVFENLLEVNDRKSKGAFYTPREIVHYMCQETLISYLVKEIGLKEQDIRDFILLGDFLKDEDTAKDRRQGDNEMLISEELYKIDKDGNVVVDRLKDIDEALKNIRVADPAVGSGAFPLGMLNEIVRARQNISAYMAITMNGYEKRMMYNNERSPYSLKRETIKNCIFAADIEPSAVDIAQLRLWLSLVIDDEINPNAQSPLDGHKSPLALPNLECNIVCGNSLIDKFEGFKLINYNEALGNTNGVQMNVFQTAFDAVLPSLLEAQDALFSCDDPAKKQQWKETIDGLKNELAKAQMDGCSPEQWERYQEAMRVASRPFVLWHIDFARVFREKGGFDVVIGNPPYVDSEEMTRSMPELRELYTSRYDCAKGNWDLFVLFIEKGMKLLNSESVISFIVPNKFVAAPYTTALRKQIATHQVQEMRDYSNVTVFKTAAVYPVVFRIKMIDTKIPVTMDVMDSMTTVSNHNIIDPDKFYADINWDKYFNSSADSLEIVEKMSKFKPLKAIADVNGAATVNEAYLVKEFLQDNPNPDFEYRKFINTGGLDPYKSFFGIEDMRYLKGKYLYPIVSVEDLEKMSGKRLKESSSEKIIIGGMTKILECFYDKGEYLAGKSTTIVYGYEHLKYITALLNSKLMTFYYSTFYNSMSLAGGFFRIGAPQIKELPIAIPDDEKVIYEIEQYVDEVLSIMDDNGSADKNGKLQELYDSIDKKVYKLYGLTDDEIQCVEEGQ
jgi:type IIS restriction enzyme R and M protein